MRPAIRQMMDAVQHIDFERPQEVRVFMIAIIDELANLDRSVSALLGYSEKEREPESGADRLTLKDLPDDFLRAYHENGDISFQDYSAEKARRDAMGGAPDAETLAEFVKQKAMGMLAGEPMDKVVRDLAMSMNRAAAQAHREGEPRRGRPASILIQPGDMVQLGHGDDESLVSDGWYMVAEVRPVGSFTVAGHEKTGVGPERVIRWFRGEQ